MTSEVFLVTHKGGCHCKKVRFEVQCSKDLLIYNCNCTICHMKHNIHFVVPARNFKLISGAEELTTYTFNSHQAKHMFCSFCGVQSFYVPRSNQNGYGINPDCLDSGTVASVKVVNFDGLNWESSIEKEKLKPNPIQSQSN